MRLLRVVNPIIDNVKSKAAPFFASLTGDLSSQLFQVAKMIEGRAATGAKRQIFFVQLGSFDTHHDQLKRQQKLFSAFVASAKCLLRRDSRVRRLIASNDVHDFRVQSAPSIQLLVGYGPRLGQSPFHYGRCGQGRVVLRAVSDAATRRTERRGAAGALDSDYLSRSVWSDSCEMVRCRPQKYQHGFRQPCSVRFIGPRFSHTEPALNPSNPGKIVSPHPKVSDPRSAAHGS